MIDESVSSGTYWLLNIDIPCDVTKQWRILNIELLINNTQFRALDYDRYYKPPQIMKTQITVCK